MDYTNDDAALHSQLLVGHVLGLVGRMLGRGACLAGLLFAQAFAQAASFDCNKAATWTEKAICASPRLSELDVELDQLYRDAISRTPDAGGARSSVRSIQRAWLQGARNTCSGQSCLESAYEQRLAVLREGKASYEGAEANPAQKDRSPSPGNGATEGSELLVDVRVAAPAPIVEATDVSKAAKVSAGASAVADSSSKPSSSNSWASGLLMLVALLQMPLTGWLVYKRTGATKGVLRGLVAGGAAATVAFLAIAIGSASVISDEEKARRQTARETMERVELAGKQQADLTASQRRQPAKSIEAAGTTTVMPVSMTVKEDARPQKVAEPESDSWYILGGQITEGAIFGTGPAVFACQEDKGPGATLEALGPYRDEVRLEDKEVVAGKPVVVVFEFRGSQQLFVRGQRRCERLAADQNSRSAEAFATKKQETNRYK